MKTRFLAFISLIIILSSCTSSRQVLELQNKIDRLESNFLQELRENALLINTKAPLNIMCIKTAVWISEEDRYKKQDKTITFDSLRTKYNLLLDKYDNLRSPYIIFKNHTDSITSKNSETIMRLVDEYKILCDSTKKSSK